MEARGADTSRGQERMAHPASMGAAARASQSIETELGLAALAPIWWRSERTSQF
jgi:hypothetical protein